VTNERAQAQTIAIRTGRMDEYDSLDALMRRASLALPEYRQHLEANPDAFDLDRTLIESGNSLVAERDGAVAGFAMWRPIGEITAEVDGLFVDPTCWRRGVGSALMTALAQTVVATGLRQLYVIAGPGSADFYRRGGFARTGVTATRFGPAVTMLLEINPYQARD
jgi:N-acetylglutamate synthase-like GNAT family acetyltransferase